MTDFYINELEVRGKTVQTSTVGFEEGVNFIIGPSDTGKTYITKCIAYALGYGDVPFQEEVTGYNTIKLSICNSKGQSLNITRKLKDRDGLSVSDSQVMVESDFDGIEDGIYSTGKAAKNRLNDLLLGLIGIDEPVMVIKNEERSPQNLTLKSIAHLFNIDIDTRAKEASILFNPKGGYASITSSLTSLMYLIDERGSTTEPADNKQIKNAKKNAVVEYISRKIASFNDERLTLEQELKDCEDEDIEAELLFMKEEIECVERQISEAEKRSRELLSRAYTVDDRLSQNLLLKEKYGQLKSQYEADLGRLDFVLEGESVINGDFGEICPFCNHEIEETVTRDSYSVAAGAERRIIERRLQELLELEHELDQEIESDKIESSKLKEEDTGIQNLINETFMPKINDLSKSLKRYQQLVTLRQRLESMNSFTSQLETDIDEKLKPDDNDAYKAKEEFSNEVLVALGNTSKAILKDSQFPNLVDAWVSRETFDIVVNGRDKNGFGEGFRSFLNLVMAYSLMTYLHKNGKHPLNILIADSPTQALTESESIVDVDTMKYGLFDYIIRHAIGCQCIIIENKLPDNLHPTKANYIEFTGDESYGRYGFMLTPQNKPFTSYRPEASEE